MPFQRKPLQTLQDEVAADIATNLPGADALLRFSNLRVLGNAQAAMVNGLYGFLDWIAKQSNPFTATDEFLEAWAGLKDITREPATFANCPATFPGMNGRPIPAGTTVVRGDNFTFVTDADAEVSGGVASVTITAIEAGSAGTTATGVALTLGTAIAGITSSGVTTGNATGVDVELDDSLRSRMLTAYARPPQGGSLGDYVNWARAVPGVTRAWNAGNVLGAGKVQVFFMMDVAEAAYGGFPQGSNGVATNETRDVAANGDQLAVANAIYPLRPVTALVYAYAPSNNPVAFTISGIPSASGATKAGIATAISGVMLAQAAPGGVTDASGDLIGIVDLSLIETAIGAVAGTTGFVITSVTCPHGAVTSGATGNISSNAGYLATLGVVTYV